MNTTKIGFFDSGIGGATVLKECIKLRPNYEYIFYSDSKNNPYGDKTKEEVIGFSEKITDYMIEKGCKIIVIACNTASAMAVKSLREKYKDITFIAIEPAIKLAYDKNGGTLIMATKGTLDSEKFHTLYEKYHTEHYYLLPCVGLANLIESSTSDKVEEYLKENLEQYVGKIQNVVLGCTHYPLVKDTISDILGKVNFFDGAIGVAKQLSRIIDENGFEETKSSITFIDSSGAPEKEKRFYEFLNK